MTLARYFGAVLVFAIGLTIAFAATAGRYEEPDYQLIERIGEVEIRDYAPRLHAEVTLTGERERSANAAFGVLAGYIFSKDTPTGEPIGMTVPVGQYTATDAAWSMWFVMPSRFTTETLPPVNDERIRIVEVPAQRLAALTFSGRMDTADFTAQTARLQEALEEAGLQPNGEPTLAVYSGPFTPGPFRRNEVLIAVQ